MKKLFTIISFLITVMLNAQVTNPHYDSTLARKLGADEHGMKMYVLVVLKTGSNDIKDKTKRDSLFAGHFDNINRLVELKKLIVAGPLSKNDQSYRGIFIIDVPTFEEAKELLNADPTIKERIFDLDLYYWYGSAALPEYLKVSDKISKIKP